MTSSKLKKTLKGYVAGIKKHKIATAVIVIACVFGGYEMYHSAKTADAAPQYVVSPAMIGNIVQTVAGTGQITAENQIDVTSKASGAITSIPVSVGKHVRAGDLIATIDATDALRSLTSAKLSYAQLTEPAKPGDIINAQNSLNKSYSDGFNSVAGAFTDLQSVMAGLNTMLYGQTGFLGPGNSSNLNPSGQALRSTAGLSYDKANIKYQAVMVEYQKLTRQSATSSINQLISDSSDMLRSVSETLQDIQNAVNYAAVNQPSYMAKDASTAQANTTSWLNTINGDVSSVSGAENGIASNENTLNNLQVGADALSVQASQLSVEQAQENYANYFIRAPFDGVIGRIPVSLFGQAGASTVIATEIGDHKIANISLDEVDAASVKVGQPVTITFNAISGFNATGTVSQVDLVGTVSAGVVSYNVKIAVSTSDDRILPGMSVNVSIVTMEKDGVLVVPTSAIKTQGNQSYVQVLSSTTVSAYLASQGTSASLSSQAVGRTGASGAFGGTRSASTTSTTGSSFGAGFRNASTTGGYASTTGGFGRGFGGSTANAAGRTGRASVSLTIPSLVAPSNMVIVTGLADNTNTEVVSGLSPRSWIVTRTIAGGSATAAAPSILNTLTGGARTGAAGAGGGAFRAGGGGAAARIGG